MNDVFLRSLGYIQEAEPENSWHQRYRGKFKWIDRLFNEIVADNNPNLQKGLSILKQEVLRT